MISYIRGELAAVQEQKAIVEAGGIGYGIYMSQQTLSMLPAVGEEVARDWDSRFRGRKK